MTYNSLQGIFTTMIGFVTWPPYGILNKMFNFLALLDIRVFGRLYVWLLIGLALFLQPGCFCLAYIITGTSQASR